MYALIATVCLGLSALTCEPYMNKVLFPTNETCMAMANKEAEALGNSVLYHMKCVKLAGEGA